MFHKISFYLATIVMVVSLALLCSIQTRIWGLYIALLIAFVCSSLVIRYYTKS